MSAAPKKKSALADMPFGIVPQNVMRDTHLSVQARFLFALLCTQADNKGCCRRSLEKIAVEAGVTDRTVMGWFYELEMGGLISKLNEVGKMGVFQIIRHSCRRGAAKVKNAMRVGERRAQFAEFGKRGAQAKARKREGEGKPPMPISPTLEEFFGGAGAKQISPEHESRTRLLEQDSKEERKKGCAALPPDGGGAPLKEETVTKNTASIGDSPSRSKADCLQGETADRGWRKLGSVTPERRKAILVEIQNKELARRQREASTQEGNLSLNSNEGGSARRAGSELRRRPDVRRGDGRTSNA